jgi:hypothetical protein
VPTRNNPYYASHYYYNRNEIREHPVAHGGNYPSMPIDRLQELENRFRHFVVLDIASA